MCGATMLASVFVSAMGVASLQSKLVSVVGPPEKQLNSKAREAFRNSHKANRNIELLLRGQISPQKYDRTILPPSAYGTVRVGLSLSLAGAALVEAAAGRVRLEMAVDVEMRWQDRRLIVPKIQPNSTVSLSAEVFGRIWRPQLFLLHADAAPQLRLSVVQTGTGKVRILRRESVDIPCSGDTRRFPLDVHRCHVGLLNGYPRDVVAVELEEALAQRDFALGPFYVAGLSEAHLSRPSGGKGDSWLGTELVVRRSAWGWLGGAYAAALLTTALWLAGLWWGDSGARLGLAGLGLLVQLALLRRERPSSSAQSLLGLAALSSAAAVFLGLAEREKERRAALERLQSPRNGLQSRNSLQGPPAEGEAPLLRGRKIRHLRLPPATFPRAKRALLAATAAGHLLFCLVAVLRSYFFY